MTITSSAFINEDYIPEKYTCDDKNINPPLTFSKVPLEAQSLVLIVEDPDAITKKDFTHWIVFNIHPATLQVLENEVPEDSIQGMTDAGKVGYHGPCPPDGLHRYVFHLYAVNKRLELPQGASKEEVKSNIERNIIDKAQLIGLYKKKETPDQDQNY